MNATTTPMTSSALVSALPGDSDQPTETTPTRPDQTARLILGGSSRPHRFDGTWWPRTRNLVDELPGLIAALREHGMPVARVAYHLDTWDEAPRKLTIEGQRIRLGGFRYIDPDQLSTTDLYHTVRVDLEVIPPSTPTPATAPAAASTAAPATEPDGQQRWETDGGPIHGQANKVPTRRPADRRTLPAGQN